MVIHCPKEEDAKDLLWHLNDLDYAWGVRRDSLFYNNGVIKTRREDGDCYCLYDDEKGRYITVDTQEYFAETEHCIITEFSDLIEPDDSPVNSPMTAKELLEFFKKYREIENGILTALFGYDGLDLILDDYTPQDIIDKITAYEAAKKAPKPVEVEEGYFCELYEKRDNCDVIILGYNMWSVDKNTAVKDVQEKARKRVIKTGMPCYSRVTYKCRVKDGES